MITVIVPVYNVEKYLIKCIDSIITQTYKDLEIILVNDGSTDNSGKICDKYKSKDKRIKVIHKDNGGLSDARNCGLKISNGEYIVFLDSDDWVDENYIKILYNLIKKYDSDMSICDFKKVYNEEEKLNSNYNEMVFSNIEALKQIHTEKGTQFIVAWNKMYKKKLLDGMKYPKGKVHEDEFLTPILLYRSNKIAYTEKELIYYRQREGSIMSNGFNLKKLDYLDALEERVKYYKDNELEKLSINEAHVLGYTIISYYYLVNKLKYDKKKKVCLMLKKRIRKVIKNNKLPITTRIKMYLFSISPEIYIKLRNLNSLA